MCLTPVTLRNDPSKYQTELTRVVPCGKCPECLKARANAWAFRLFTEMKRSSSAAFLTLTYTDETLPKTLNGNHTLDKRDYQLFMKRLRKKIRKEDIENAKYRVKEHYTTKAGKDKWRWKHTRKLRYYVVGEYGTQTKRPHYHAIIFNLPKLYLLDPVHLERSWQQGLIHIGNCEQASIKYTLKYMQKGRWEPENELDDRNPQFAAVSKNMGLNYLTKQMVNYLRSNEHNYITHPQGYKSALPKYYKEKVYTETERKILAKKAILHTEENQLFESEKEKITWTKDQFRKAEKAIRLQQEKL